MYGLITGEQNQETGYTQYYGWQAPGPHRTPKGIGLGVKMYGQKPQWFTVAGTSPNYYVFTLDPGDLGKVRFNNTALQWKNGALIMERGDQAMRYIKRSSR